MNSQTLDRLQVNSPYEEPQRHGHCDPMAKLFSPEDVRRPAGYVVASETSKAFADPAYFVEIPLVYQIRPNVKDWREM